MAKRKDPQPSSSGKKPVARSTEKTSPKRKGRPTKSNKVELTKVQKTSTPKPSTPKPRAKSPGRGSRSAQSLTPSPTKRGKPQSSKAAVAKKANKEPKKQNRKPVANANRQPRRSSSRSRTAVVKTQNPQNMTNSRPVVVRDEPMDMVDGLGQGHVKEQATSKSWFRSCSIV